MRRWLVAILVSAVVASAVGYGATSALQARSTPTADAPSPLGGPAAIPLVWQAHEVGPVAFGATACAGGTRCLAFGPDGIVARSDDGGRTWSLSKLAATTELTVLTATCPTAERCVALAQAGSPPASPRQLPRAVPLVSPDGGGSWTRAAVSGSPVSFLRGLACPSATWCYATAEDTTSPAAGGFLLESDDGGASWTVRRHGPADGLSGALACPVVGHCFATGGAGGLVATSDGGRSWTDETEPMGGGGRPGISVLACSSLTACTGAGIEPSPGYPVLVTTADGGRSWHFATLERADGPEQGEIAGGGYDAISCASSRCVAVGATLPAVGLVSESDDGGRTWRDAVLGAGGSLSDATCASDAGCVVAGTIGNGEALLALGDGASPAWHPSYVGSPTEWSTFTCPSPAHCVAAAGSGPYSGVHVVATTADGGAHWTEARLPAGVEGIVALDCPTLRHCVAIADVPASQKVQQESETETVAAVLSSDDGGRSWRRDAVDAPVDTLDALSCPSASSCYAVGATLGANGQVPDDAVVTTTDGATRWAADSLPAFPPQPPTGTSGSEILGGGLTSIACFSATSCLAAGAAGVLATGDGVHWSLRYEVPGPDNGGVVDGGTLFGQLQLLACPVPTRCLGVFSDPNGESLRISTDGGRSWRSPVPHSRTARRSFLPSTFSALALTCPSLSRCIVSGSDAGGAVVFVSKDGGDEWQKAPLPALTGAGSLEGAPTASYGAIGCAGPDWCLIPGAGGVGEVAVASSADPA